MVNESRAAGASCVERLAGLFPHATAVRIPVRARCGACAENTVIEFGTPTEVLFACSLPLEIGDHIHLANADGSLDATAVVAAIHCHSEQNAVAARFTTPVPNWIIK